jgi:hypothetical protein
MHKASPDTSEKQRWRNSGMLICLFYHGKDVIYLTPEITSLVFTLLDGICLFYTLTPTMYICIFYKFYLLVKISSSCVRLMEMPNCFSEVTLSQGWQRVFKVKCHLLRQCKRMGKYLLSNVFLFTSFCAFKFSGASQFLKTVEETKCRNIQEGSFKFYNNISAVLKLLSESKQGSNKVH